MERPGFPKQREFGCQAHYLLGSEYGVRLSAILRLYTIARARVSYEV
jgi:hypothetical protein